MALFPKNGTQYFDEKDRDIQKKMENFYRESLSINQLFWAEADLDTRFEAGDQSVFFDIYKQAPLDRSKNFNFNRIRRVVNMISGYQRRNRKSTIVVPVENADDQTADQFSKILSWCNQQENILNTISDAFHGALVSGINLLQVWVDYRNDPISGNIKIDNCSYNSFLLDPFFRKKDLSDCNTIWKRSYLTKREILSLLPEYKEEISPLSGTNARDGKFQYMPENFDIGQKNLLSFDEYYYRTFRTQRMLVDSQTGETMEWRSKDEDALKEFLRLYPQVTVADQEIPTVNLSIVVQGKVVYDGKNLAGVDTYPFIPVFGYFNPQLSNFAVRLQGVVRGLRDAQFLYNRRKVIELDVAESKATTGWIAKENAPVDHKDLYKTGQGRTIILKETAQMSDIQPIPAQDVPPSFFHMSEYLGQEIQQISGVNEELLGSATDDKAGILSMLRQGAGLTTLQMLFDQLDMSQRLLGKLMIDIVQGNFSAGKVKRIIEDEPTPQFFNKAFGKYDAAVEEGLNTTTQRQVQFAQLLQLKEVGVPVPDDVLLEAATIQNKKKLVDSIRASNEQKSQIDQLTLQSTIQEQEARTNLANARATADTGLGIERMSRVEENQELAKERRAEAHKDRTQGILNIVKTLQEIDDIDIGQIQKLLALADLVKRNVNTDELEPTKTSTLEQMMSQGPAGSPGINQQQEAM